jgi:hypothetical protein
MTIAYLILAHANPKLIEKAIARLSYDDCGFFVHIDQKSRMEEFSRIPGGNIFFIEPRLPVYWGDFSQVDAILLLLRQSLQAPGAYDRFVLLSGSDYPLRSGKYINAFFQEHRGEEFISGVKVPNEAAGKPLSRINKFVVPQRQPLRRLLVRGLGKLGLAERDYRKYLGSLQPYAGSEWWALTREACQYVLQFVDSRPEVTDFFRNVCAADEAFFQTILANSEFQSRMRRNLVYDDWSARASSPAMIGADHIGFFEAHETVPLDDVYGHGEALFARKFCDGQIEFAQKVDEIILQKENNDLRKNNDLRGSGSGSAVCPVGQCLER